MSKESYFDRVLDFAEPVMPPLCGAFLMVAGLQYFYPQDSEFYLIVAGLAFVVSVVLKMPAAYRRLQYGN